jgi:hypothetical protein
MALLIVLPTICLLALDHGRTVWTCRMGTLEVKSSEHAVVSMGCPLCKIDGLEVWSLEHFGRCGALCRTDGL